MNKANVTIFGGNGFVGCAIAEQMQRNGHTVSCVSRTGAMPLHLQKNNHGWANDVEWLKGDVATPDTTLLEASDIIVTTVGSPPVPTFGQGAFDAQFHANGQANIELLEACANLSAKHIIVVSALIPKPVQHPKFAYYAGKQAVIDRAIKLFNGSDSQVSILQPSMIFGNRHTKSGSVIPLGFMKFPSKVLQKFSFSAAPISVHDIANTCSQLVSEKPTQKNMVKIISNSKILDIGASA